MANKNYISGYSLIELILAVFVGSIVIAGAYASYSVVAAQYNRSSGVSEIRDFAVPTIGIISRDLRMAGHRAVDSNIESVYGKIDPPIQITDTASACCDSFFVAYDKDESTRLKVTYTVAARTNPDRNALFMDIDQWDGNAWNNTTNDAIVADYVEDFQIEGSDNNSAGYPTLISFNIVFKSKNKNQTPVTFTKSAYGSGNNDSYTITDNYLREEFDTSVILRNLIDY